MAVKIDLSSLKGLKEALEKSASTRDELVSYALHDIAEEVIKNAKETTPVDTGLLRRSYFSNYTRDTDGSYVCEVYNNVAYARFVENGHRIVSSDGTTIGFVDGKFMLKTAEANVERRVDDIIKRATNKYLKGLIKWLMTK